MKTHENLFAEFAPVSREQWQAKAKEDIKGADYHKKLVWQTDDGFNVKPFYTAEDMAGLESQSIPFPPGKRHWTKYVEIRAGNDLLANRTALELKKLGANGFLFRLDNPGQHNVEMLLQGLDATQDEISFATTEPSAVLLSEFLVYLNKSYILANKLKGFYECDVMENWSLSGGKLRFHELADLLRRSKPYKHFRCLTIRSHSFVNAGSNTTQELAYTLHKLSDYIDALHQEGLSVAEIIDEVVLHMAISGDYFFEIAKLRALRILLEQVLEFYGCEAYSIPIVSSNAQWSKTFYDPNVNMLRNTAESMSAILGGCDALLVQAHDSANQEPGDFSRRIALNVSNILQHESYFDKVTDPAAGSYYIENLTSQLVTQTLAEFRDIEAKGGYISAFRNGVIQQRIREQRVKKQREISTRKRVYVGTNKYPDTNDEHVKTLIETSDMADALELLPQQHATCAFENLRSRTLIHFRRTGFIPEVYLFTFGNLAMRKARAGFAEDFFNTAGFEVLGEFFHENIENGVQEAASGNADVVVLCSSDEEYAAAAAAIARQLKELAPQKLVILAGYPESIVPELRTAGVDEFIHLRSDAVEVLTGLQNKLLA